MVESRKFTYFYFRVHLTKRENRPVRTILLTLQNIGRRVFLCFPSTWRRKVSVGLDLYKSSLLVCVLNICLIFLRNFDSLKTEAFILNLLASILGLFRVSSKQRTHRLWVLDQFFTEVSFGSI